MLCSYILRIYTFIIFITFFRPMPLLGTITKNASVSIGLIQALAYLILRDEDKTQKGTVITGASSCSLCWITYLSVS